MWMETKAQRGGSTYPKPHSTELAKLTLEQGVLALDRWLEWWMDRWVGGRMEGWLGRWMWVGGWCGQFVGWMNDGSLP